MDTARIRTWRRISVLAGIALAASVTAAAQESEAEQALVASGERPDLILMHTGDVIGYLEDCGCKVNPAGGLARRAWVVKQVKNRFPGVPLLLLDSGNFSDNPTPQGDLRTKTLLTAMEQLEYRVVNVGERDIRLGYDEFRARTEPGRFHFVSANIVKQGSGEPIFEPRAVLELPAAPAAGAAARTVIGVTGVARFNPMFLKAGPDGSNMVFANHVDSVRREVAALRAENVDLVVVLAALHLNDARRIAEEVPGIDFILGAYGGLFVDERVGPTKVLYCGNRGQRLAETRIFLRPGDDRSRRVEPAVRMHFLTADYPESTDMRRFLDLQPSAVLGSEDEAAAAAGSRP